MTRQPPTLVHLRLYVAGQSPNSALALRNLRTLTERLLPQRCRIEVVDVLSNPGRALADGIVVTPTLLKVVAGPAQRIVGTLEETPFLCALLGT